MSRDWTKYVNFRQVPLETIERKMYVCTHTYLKNPMFHVDNTFSEIMCLITLVFEAPTFNLPRYLTKGLIDF